MKQTKTKNVILLFSAALIWGIAFVAQQVGMDFLNPMAFTGIRCMLGAVVLIPVVYSFARQHTPEQKAQISHKATWIGGLLCGLVLAVGMNLQQLGLQHTTVGKAGFITTLYIVIVPILGIFFRKRIGAKIWISVGIAMVGLYLLSMTESLKLEFGDAVVFISAFVFSGHILVIDHFNPKVDGVKMSCIQFFTAATLSLLGMLFWEGLPSWENIMGAAVPLLYTGILSSAVAFTFQILGQRDMNPTVASLLLSLESAIAAIAAWLILQQGMSTRELFGAGLMFAAIVLAQLPEKHASLNRVGDEPCKESGSA